MALRFYDFEFNLIHIEPRFVSSSWSIRHSAPGTFEAHFPIESEVLSVVAQNKYLVAVQGDFAAIVTGYDTHDDFAVYGRTCNWILSKRIVLPFEEISDNGGSIAYRLVSDAFGDVSNFISESVSVGEAITFSKQNPATVLDAVTDCLAQVSLGHEVRFDIENKQWVFKVTASKQNDLVISESLKNASDTAITADILDRADCGYYEKRTEAADGSTTQSYEYLCNSDVASGIYRWEALLSGSSESEGKSSLMTKKENSTLTLNTHDILYGTDYSLGDIVRVQFTKGALKKTEKKRICGVDIQYKNAEKFEQPVFEEV